MMRIAISPRLATRTLLHIGRGSLAPASPRQGDAGGVLEAPVLLAVLHGGLRDAVVGSRLAALGDRRGGDLEHNFGERQGARAHAAGAAHVTYGAVADGLGEDLLAVDQLG